MRTVPLSERASTLEVHTYAFAIRSALRRARVFLPGDHLVGPRLPSGPTWMATRMPPRQY
jgi:cell division protease FtsH